MLSSRCIGIIETRGLAAAIQAADTAVKTGNVRLIGYEYNGYDATVAVKIEGKVSAVKAAALAASATAQTVKGDWGGFMKYSVRPALKEEVYDILVDNKNTVGTKRQIESGRRPQGTGKRGKWVGIWNPKGCYIYE